MKYLNTLLLKTITAAGAVAANILQPISFVSEPEVEQRTCYRFWQCRKVVVEQHRFAEELHMQRLVGTEVLTGIEVDVDIAPVEYKLDLLPEVLLLYRAVADLLLVGLRLVLGTVEINQNKC